MERLSVVWLGGLARQALCGCGQGRIVAAFTNSVHVEVADTIACIVAARLGNGPCNAVLDPDAPPGWPIMAGLPGTPVELCLARGIVGRFHGREVGIQRCLDVNHQHPVVGHADEHVGALQVLRLTRCFLFIKVAMLDHTCKFRESSQGHFTPLAAHLGASQRIDQVTSLSLKLVLSLSH